MVLRLPADEAAALLGDLRTGRRSDPPGAATGDALLVAELGPGVAELTPHVGIEPGRGSVGRGPDASPPDEPRGHAPLDLRPPAGMPLVVVAAAPGPDLPATPRGADLYLTGAARPELDRAAPGTGPPGTDRAAPGTGPTARGAATGRSPLPAPWVAPPDGLEAGLDRLAAVVHDQPLAASTLAQLLRLRPRLGLADAVVAESMAYSLLQAGPEHARWLAGRPLPRPVARGGEVRVERRGATLHLTFGRPERRNAYNAAARDGLVEALQLASSDPTITAIHLAGEGPSFSSGGDLSEFGTRPDPATAHAIRTSRNAGLWLASLADRTTVRVHGPCFGAGVELPAFARRVVADPGTTFTLPEVAMGLVPGAGGTASIPVRIGSPRTAWLGLSGQPVDAATALAWGLVDELAPVAPAP